MTRATRSRDRRNFMLTALSLVEQQKSQLLYVCVYIYAYMWVEHTRAYNAHIW